MTTALRRFLPEFEAPSRARLPVPAWKLLDRAPPASALVEAEPEPLAEAAEPEPARDPLAEAVAAALAEAERHHAAALAQHAARAAAELAEARASWVADEGRVFAEQFAKAATAAGDGIADAVASLLEPFLEEAIRHAAVAELRQAVSDLVASGAGGRIAVSGPQDLLDGLAAALDRSGTSADRLDLTPSQAVEVAIMADSSVVRTRLGDWMGALRRRLEVQS